MEELAVKTRSGRKAETSNEQTNVGAVEHVGKQFNWTVEQFGKLTRSTSKTLKAAVKGMNMLDNCK